MDPDTLYNALINLQDLVDLVEESDTRHISWPLVSYCDQMWSRLFPGANTAVFFSVTREHNYTIGSFSAELYSALETLLDEDQCKYIVGDRPLHYLQLASIEEENLPLYAIIGHEFGHAYWSHHQTELGALFSSELDPVTQKIACSALEADNIKEIRPEDLQRFRLAINKIAIELFCDLVGIKLIGCAFLISLDELSWGQVSRAQWRVTCDQDMNVLRAYPSFTFRLALLKETFDLEQFAAEFRSSLNVNLHKHHSSFFGMERYPLQIDSVYINDSFKVNPGNHPVSVKWENAFSKNKSDLQNALSALLRKVERDFLARFPTIFSLKESTPSDLAKLVNRLAQNIPPNIIPDNNSLFGRPALLVSILNAAAFFRIHVLTRMREAFNVEDVARDTQRVERLTAKALEMTFVQHQYNQWRSKTPQA